MNQTNLTMADVVAFFGSKKENARVLGVSPQAVTNWGDSMPASAAINLERASGGQLKAVHLPVRSAAA